MPIRLILIDNFDSFVYNLRQYLDELGCRTDVFRNNELTIEEIGDKRYDGIVISPGSGNPCDERDFGVCAKVIARLGTKVPLLGVCLGHQGIISVFGGKIIRAKKPMHGKVSVVKHDGKGIFAGVKNPLRVMRYHSLVSEEETLPSCLEINARSEDDGAIMAIQHKAFPVFGVQFHPESILTEDGKKILGNFLKSVRR